MIIGDNDDIGNYCGLQDWNDNVGSNFDVKWQVGDTTFCIYCVSDVANNKLFTQANQVKSENACWFYWN